MAVLDSLTNDNLIQHNNLKILKPLVKQRLMLLKANLDKLHNRQPNKIADALLLNSKYKMDEVRRQVAKMLHQEDTLLKQRIQFKNRSESFPPVLLLLLSLFSILIITLFFFRLQKETRMRILLDESNRLLHEAKQQIEASAQDLKRYKHMADNATEPFILMRQDGTFAYLNELALQRWGYTKEEAQHLRVPDVDPIYNDEVFNQAFEEAQKATLPQFETTHKKKNGTIYPVEINMGGLTLEGKPHLFAIARDITERKKLEEAIRENQEKIRSFILQAPVAMCLYRGPQHIIEIVNEELLSIWDKPLDSVINKPVFEALPEARGQGFEALLDKVYTTGEKFVAFGIPIVLSRNGKPKTIYVNLVYQAYREVDGTISGIVEVVSDATEQVVATQQIEASENQFRTFADSIQSLAWIANADGWIYWYNQRWYDYTGTTLEEMQGWGWDKVHHPDHIKGVVEFVKEAWKKTNHLN